ncbi:MAG: hypothetical protein AAF391_08100, partial [Bacteroidota bacterium]
PQLKCPAATTEATTEETELERGNIGAWDKGQEVRNLLIVTKGTFGSLNVAKFNCRSDVSQPFPQAGKDKVIVEQEYQMFIRR